MKGPPTKKKAGFTLAEMLVTVSIIITLSVTTLVGVTIVSRKSQYQKAKQDIIQIMDAIRLARINSGKTLMEITESSCSECQCQSKGNLKNLSKTDICWTAYYNAVDNINKAAGGNYILPKEDPWGGPYMIDENEGENPQPGACGQPASPTHCYADVVQSAGPDNNVDEADDNLWTWLETANCKPEVRCWQDYENNWD